MPNPGWSSPRGVSNVLLAVTGALMLIAASASFSQENVIFSENFDDPNQATLEDLGFRDVQFWEKDAAGYMINVGPGDWAGESKAHTPLFSASRTEKDLIVEWSVYLNTEPSAAHWRENNKTWVALRKNDVRTYVLLWKPNRKQDQYTSYDLRLYKKVNGKSITVKEATTHLLTPPKTWMDFRMTLKPSGEISVELDNGTGTFTEYINVADTDFNEFDDLQLKYKTGPLDKNERLAVRLDNLVVKQPGEEVESINAFLREAAASGGGEKVFDAGLYDENTIKVIGTVKAIVE